MTVSSLHIGLIPYKVVVNADQLAGINPEEVAFIRSVEEQHPMTRVVNQPDS